MIIYVYQVGSKPWNPRKRSLFLKMEKCLRNSKIFSLCSFSLYIITSSQEVRAFKVMWIKSYGALKIPKMACSMQVNFFCKNRLIFSFFKLTTKKILDYKEMLLLFYVSKSISFEVIRV